MNSHSFSDRFTNGNSRSWLSDDDTFVDLVQGAGGLSNDQAHQTTESALGDETSVPQEIAEHPRYEIDSLVGSGGMGRVYKAQHRMMQREVALKVINKEWVGHPEAIQRFHREVQTAAKLSHPNIVTAYDAEQAGDQHFLVMEFVDGVDLAQTVKKQGPLPVETACDYIRQAAEGLQYAHERGMVHRDIKPHNLMVTNDNVVKVLDFGLASLVTSSQADSGKPNSSGNLTVAGSIMGTPDFISPEQASDARQADIRSDIYSLGMTFYFLLSGEKPFPKGEAVDKLRQHAEEEPVPLFSLRDDLPEGLESILDRMIAKNPEDRFQTPAEVVEALEEILRVIQSGALDSSRQGSSIGGNFTSSDGAKPITGDLSPSWLPSLANWLFYLAFVPVGLMLFETFWLEDDSVTSFDRLLYLYVPAVICLSTFAGIARAVVKLKSDEARYKGEDRRIVRISTNDVLLIFSILAVALLMIFSRDRESVADKLARYQPGVQSLDYPPENTARVLLDTVEGEALDGRPAAICDIDDCRIALLGQDISKTDDHTEGLYVTVSGTTESTKRAIDYDKQVIFSSKYANGEAKCQFHDFKFRMKDREILIGKNSYVWRDPSSPGLLILVDQATGKITTQSMKPRSERVYIEGAVKTSESVVTKSITSNQNDEQKVRPERSRTKTEAGSTTSQLDIPATPDESGEFPATDSKLILSQDLMKNFIRSGAHLEKFEQELFSVISRDAGIPNDQWEKTAQGFDTGPIEGTPLSALLLMTPPAEDSNPDEPSPALRTLTKRKPKPLEFHKAMSLSDSHGYVSLIQPEYISRMTLDFDRETTRFKGTVWFEAPKLYAGKVDVTLFYHVGRLKVTEFKLPDDGLSIVTNGKGVWQIVSQDLKLLQGDWDMIEFAQNGKIGFAADKGVRMQLRFNGNRLIRRQTAPDGETVESEWGPIKLNSTTNPKSIDIISPNSPADRLLGIYELQNNTLKICFAEQSNIDIDQGHPVKRPTRFVAPDGSDLVLLECKRVVKTAEKVDLPKHAITPNTTDLLWIDLRALSGKNIDQSFQSLLDAAPPEKREQTRELFNGYRKQAQPGFESLEKGIEAGIELVVMGGPESSSAFASELGDGEKDFEELGIEITEGAPSNPGQFFVRMRPGMNPKDAIAIMVETFLSDAELDIDSQEGQEAWEAIKTLEFVDIGDRWFAATGEYMLPLPRKEEALDVTPFLDAMGHHKGAAIRFASLMNENARFEMDMAQLHAGAMFFGGLMTSLREMQSTSGGVWLGQRPKIVLDMEFAKDEDAQIFKATLDNLVTFLGLMITFGSDDSDDPQEAQRMEKTRLALSLLFLERDGANLSKTFDIRLIKRLTEAGLPWTNLLKTGEDDETAEIEQ